MAGGTRWRQAWQHVVINNQHGLAKQPASQSLVMASSHHGRRHRWRGMWLKKKSGSSGSAEMAAAQRGNRSALYQRMAWRGGSNIGKSRVRNGGIEAYQHAS